MIELLRLILHIMASLFKPRAKLVAEILILRQQLNVLRRQVSKRPRRPSSWRNQLEQISAERKVSLNVALEADRTQQCRKTRPNSARCARNAFTSIVR
jgi:hypothetical protein